MNIIKRIEEFRKKVRNINGEEIILTDVQMFAMNAALAGNIIKMPRRQGATTLTKAIYKDLTAAGFKCKVITNNYPIPCYKHVKKVDVDFDHVITINSVGPGLLDRQIDYFIIDGLREEECKKITEMFEGCNVIGFESE